MPLSYAPFFPQALHEGVLQLAAVNTTNTLNVIVGGTNGTKIEAIVATSNDNIDHALTISMNVSGTLYKIATVNIPANTGNLITLPVNILANNELTSFPLDGNGNRYLYLANAASALTVASNSTMTTTNVVNIIVQAADY